MESENTSAQSPVVQALAEKTTDQQTEPLDCWFPMATELGHLLRHPESAAGNLKGLAKGFVDRLHTLVQDHSDQALFVAVRALQDKRFPFCAAHAMAMAAAAGLMTQCNVGLLASRETIMQTCLLMNISQAQRLDESRFHLDRAAASAGDACLVSHAQDSVNLLRTSGFVDEDSLRLILQHHDSAAETGGSSVQVGGDQSLALIQLLERACEELSQTRRAPAVVSASHKLLFDEARMPTELALLYFRCVGLYPPGTAVQLFSGERAVVFRRGESIHKPVVQSVIGADGRWLKRPLPRDTAQAPHEIVRVLPWHTMGLPLDKALKAFWWSSAPTLAARAN